MSLRFPYASHEVQGSSSGKSSGPRHIAVASECEIQSKKDETTNRSYLKFCSVCGDAAAGNYYGATTCNGCKAFFRRSFLFGKQYECKKRGKCKIFKRKRIPCRACRYSRCVEVGMKPPLPRHTECITSGRPMYAATMGNVESHETLAIHSATSKLLRFDQREFDAIIGSLAYSETQCDFLRRFTFDPTYSQLSLADLINSPSELGKFHAYQEMKRDFYQLVEEWPKKQPPPVDHHWQKRLYPILASKFWILCDLVLSVEFTKTLSFFEKLSYNDKLLLLKEVTVVTCSLMQSYYSYKSKSNTVVFPDGLFPILFTNRPLPVEMVMRYRGVDSLIRLAIDEREYVLLKAIISTHCPHEGFSAEGRTLLEGERQKFARVLFNYSNARYGAGVGACRFGALISLVGTFFGIGDKYRQYHALISVALNISKVPSKLMDETLL